MGLFTRYIPDDRGRRVKALNIYDSRNTTVDSEAFPTTEHELIQRHVEWFTGSNFLRGVAMLVLLAAVLILDSTPVGSWTSWPRTLAHSGVIVTFCFLYILAIEPLIGRREANFVRGVMLRRRRCASCGYSIDGFKPDEDGCTVCPECGAAWNLTSRSS